jgi:hypothetical protein
VIGFLALEAYVVWAIVDKGFTNTRAVTGLLGGGLLLGIGLQFKKLFENNFLKREVLPMRRLHKLATERSSINEVARRANRDVFETRQALVTNTLKFIEETLHNWVKGTHFELCVFVDADQPFLFAYFDSNHDEVARSMKLREASPSFYIDKGYEVTKVLRSPTSMPRVIGDTHKADAKYKFTTDEQRKQIRSSVLISLDLGYPVALVVSSDAKDAFKDGDRSLLSFIRYAGELIRSDLIEDGFAKDMRELRPEIFPAAAPSIENKTRVALPKQ